MNKKIEQIKNTRLFLLDQVKHLSVHQLNEIPKDFNNNIIWNLAHLISSQQSICYVRAQVPIIVDEKSYTSFRPKTKPGQFIDQAEIEMIKELFIHSIDKFQSDFEENIFVNYPPWLARPYGVNITNINEAIDFLIFHEGLHCGSIIALKHLL